MPTKRQIARVPMGHYNMKDFLSGQSSKILTALSQDDTTGFILKNGKPLVVVISNERYERMMRAGIDVNDELTWATKKEGE